MSKSKKIWLFFIVLWLYLWLVLALELVYAKPGITVSTLFYTFTAPVLVGFGLWWVKK